MKEMRNRCITKQIRLVKLIIGIPLFAPGLFKKIRDCPTLV